MDAVQAQALTATPIQVDLPAGQVASPIVAKDATAIKISDASGSTERSIHPKTSSIEALSLAMFECFKSHVKRRKRCELRGTGEQCLDTLGNRGLVETRHKELLRQMLDASSLIRGTKQMIGEDFNEEALQTKINEAQQAYQVLQDHVTSVEQARARAEADKSCDVDQSGPSLRVKIETWIGRRCFYETNLQAFLY